MNDAQKFLLDHGLDDKWVGIPKFSNAVAVDAKGVYVSDLMEYWRKQGAKNTEQQLQLDSRINRLPDNQENAIKNILNDKIKIEKEVAIKRLGETESSTVSTFMGVNIKEFTKEELIKILSLQQRKWLESIGFKYEE